MPIYLWPYEREREPERERVEYGGIYIRYYIYVIIYNIYI